MSASKDLIIHMFNNKVPQQLGAKQIREMVCKSAPLCEHMCVFCARRCLCVCACMCIHVFLFGVFQCVHTGGCLYVRVCLCV